MPSPAKKCSHELYFRLLCTQAANMTWTGVDVTTRFLTELVLFWDVGQIVSEQSTYSVENVVMTFVVSCATFKSEF